MKYVLLVFISIMLLTRINAQKFRAGLSAGIDASRMTINEAGGTPITYKNKLAGGLFAEVALFKLLTIQAEVNYSPQGNAAADAQNTLSFNFNYLTFPLLLKLSGTENLKFVVGGQYGILVNAKLNVNNNPPVDYKEQIKSRDYYAVFGAEYDFANGVFVGGRYTAGLTNISSDAALNFHNRYFSFRIGYSFSRKK